MGMARSTPAKAPLPHSTRPSASSERRSMAGVAPRAAQTAISGSRRTARARIDWRHWNRQSRTAAEAANSTHKMVFARELIWSCIRFTSIWKWSRGLVDRRVCGQHPRMYSAQLRARRIEIGAGSEPRKHLSHAMFAAGHHGGRQVMRAGDDVGDQFRFHRVGDGGLEDTNDVADRVCWSLPRRRVFPITLGSEFNEVCQNR